nr:MAG TPA: serine/threonine-protein kinase [Caudoviricetes sp.]
MLIDWHHKAMRELRNRLSFILAQIISQYELL